MPEQIKIKTAKDLQDIVKPILSPYLGTYTTPGGSVYDAIRITPPLVPPDWRMEGLECIIFENPKIDDYVVTGGLINLQMWYLKLVQWDRAESTLPAFQALRQVFPKVEYRLMAQNRETHEQRIVSIYDPRFELRIF